MRRVTVADRRRLDREGWVQIDALLGPDDVGPARAAAERRWPDAAAVADGPCAGLDEFPFADLELSRLAVHPAVTAAAETLLGRDGLRLYHVEAWAKHAGAADYDQDLHRDFVNHTLTVPTDDPDFGQLLCYLYLADVRAGDGPTRFVARPLTRTLPLFPQGLDRDRHADLYAAEQAATGPAGTLVAYRADTFHRASALTGDGGRRFTLLLSFRPAAMEWGQRYGWADRAGWPGWRPFVEAATPRQLELVGFPAPGHPFWTEATLAGTAARYPGLNLEPWFEARSSS